MAIKWKSKAEKEAEHQAKQDKAKAIEDFKNGKNPKSLADMADLLRKIL